MITENISESELISESIKGLAQLQGTTSLPYGRLEYLWTKAKQYTRSYSLLRPVDGEGYWQHVSGEFKRLVEDELKSGVSAGAPMNTHGYSDGSDLGGESQALGVSGINESAFFEANYIYDKKLWTSDILKADKFLSIQSIFQKCELMPIYFLDIELLKINSDNDPNNRNEILAQIKQYLDKNNDSYAEAKNRTDVPADSDVGKMFAQIVSEHEYMLNGYTEISGKSFLPTPELAKSVKSETPEKSENINLQYAVQERDVSADSLKKGDLILINGMPVFIDKINKNEVIYLNPLTGKKDARSKTYKTETEVSKNRNKSGFYHAPEYETQEQTFSKLNREKAIKALTSMNQREEYSAQKDKLLVILNSLGATENITSQTEPDTGKYGDMLLSEIFPEGTSRTAKAQIGQVKSNSGSGALPIIAKYAKGKDVVLFFVQEDKKQETQIDGYPSDELLSETLNRLSESIKDKYGAYPEITIPIPEDPFKNISTGDSIRFTFTDKELANRNGKVIKAVVLQKIPTDDGLKSVLEIKSPSAGWMKVRSGMGNAEKLPDSERVIIAESSQSQIDTTELNRSLQRTTEDGLAIYTVNGTYVRNKLFTDFTMGGHSYVYDFVPENEVWIDDCLNDIDREATIVHELKEARVMRDEKFDYVTAHDQFATPAEREFRAGIVESAMIAEAISENWKNEILSASALSFFEKILSDLAEDVSPDKTGKQRQYIDTGEKIGGARKDLWAAILKGDRRLDTSDMDGMDSATASTLVKKAHVIKGLMEQYYEGGIEPGALYMIDRLFASIASKPKDTEADRKNYVIAVGKLHEYLMTVTSFEDFKAVASQIKDEITGYSATPEQREMIDRVHKANAEWAKARNEHWQELGRTLGWRGPRKRLDIPHWAWVAENEKKYLPSNEEIYQVQKLEFDLERAEIDNPDSPRNVFNALGDKFINSLTDKKSAFQDKLDGKGIPTDFSWMNKGKGKDKTGAEGEDGESPATESKSDKPKWKREVSDTVERTGVDRDFKPQDLIDIFGIRGVEYGNWVDQETAEHHTKMIGLSFMDMSDTLGIPLKHISYGGRLAMRVGSNGKGKASAHYEPDRKAINMTKLKGGGSLAHEWSHFLDNILDSKSADGRQFSSLSDSAMVSAQSGKTWDGNYRTGQMGNKLPAKVTQAYAGLMAAMIEGSETLKNRPSDKNKSQLKYKGYFREIDDALKKYPPQEVMDIISDKASEGKYRGLKISELANYIHYETDTKVMYSSGKKMSKFLADSKSMGSDYWTRPHEMFARAFECYVSDKTEENGIINSYLCSGVRKQDFQEGVITPYPQGDEREKINAAFDKLMDALKSENILESALKMAEIDEYDENYDKNVKRISAWERDLLSATSLNHIEVVLKTMLIPENDITDAEIAKIMSKFNLPEDITIEDIMPFKGKLEFGTLTFGGLKQSLTFQRSKRKGFRTSAMCYIDDVFLRSPSLNESLYDFIIDLIQNEFSRNTVFNITNILKQKIDRIAKGFYEASNDWFANSTENPEAWIRLLNEAKDFGDIENLFRGIRNVYNRWVEARISDKLRQQRLRREERDRAETSKAPKATYAELALDAIGGTFDPEPHMREAYTEDLRLNGLKPESGASEFDRLADENLKKADDFQLKKRVQMLQSAVAKTKDAELRKRLDRLQSEVSRRSAPKGKGAAAYVDKGLDGVDWSVFEAAKQNQTQKPNLLEISTLSLYQFLNSINNQIADIQASCEVA